MVRIVGQTVVRHQLLDIQEVDDWQTLSVVPLQKAAPFINRLDPVWFHHTPGQGQLVFPQTGGGQVTAHTDKTGDRAVFLVQIHAGGQIGGEVLLI